MEFLGKHIRNVQIELTTRCALECSRCQRTNAGSELDRRVDLSLAALQNLFEPINLGTDKYQGMRVYLGGLYGDPIYHPNLAEMVSYLVSHGLKIDLTTNGSGRSGLWWNNLVSVLPKRSLVTFSVDGLADTNGIYRKNSNFDQILTGMRACAGKVRVCWKFIVFKHNEHQIRKARELARRLGVNEFKIHKSARFRHQGEDPLRPSERWVSERLEDRRRLHGLLRKGDHVGLREEFSIVPKCRLGEATAFVNAGGYFTPCVTASAHYSGNQNSQFFYENRGAANLNERPISEIVTDPFWSHLDGLWQDPVTAPRSCLMTCGTNKQAADGSFIPTCGCVVENTTVRLAKAKNKNALPLGLGG